MTSNEFTNKIYFAYALIDPRNNNIKYIGVTSRKLEIRLKEHIINSRCLKVRESRTFKANWIRQLLKMNLTPKIKYLGQTTADKIDNLEIELIAHYKQFCKLTNNSIGGKTVKGRIVTKEVREKQSQRMLNIPNPARWVKVELENLVTGEKKVFNNYEEAAAYLEIKKDSLAQAARGRRNSICKHLIRKV
jgi:hypothetical protein